MISNTRKKFNPCVFVGINIFIHDKLLCYNTYKFCLTCHVFLFSPYIRKRREGGLKQSDKTLFPNSVYLY